ncbi:hypothetical protein Nepgr_024294 [Nepenthes gracilis]|uniref:Erythronate-4-phosphate dehydrogenase family protein n=1 Tax=Nepenthes gracilis TaxID=150966 RepID=A0AAD3T4F4_NEPGR|nr:hypothetical protein Nepgr_024294 [Nepenthes gracilis]
MPSISGFSAMKQQDNESSMSINKSSNSSKLYRLINGPEYQPSIWLEVRLFYVRISPCMIDSVPIHLTLRHVHRELGVSLEVNGSRVPDYDTGSSMLRRDRTDKESSEVTYVSTDSVRISGGVEFEIYEKENMMLCGSLQRLESIWSNGNGISENDSRKGWSMDCYASIGAGSSAFFQPKLGVSSSSIEVFIAGCCSGVPVILTKTINTSPRGKPTRHNMLDAIPEDQEIGEEQKTGNGFLRHQKLQFIETEDDDCKSAGKYGHSLYHKGMYDAEDGQLSWFNAGVRVGVGIGLGMCLGIGIGVGLLMHTYQATTRTFKRRFL